MSDDDTKTLDDILSTEANKEAREGRFKKKYIKYVIGVAVVLFILLLVISCQPRQGSSIYGICSTFLELNTQYPHTLRYLDTETSRTAVRIYFTQVDAFGQLKQEMIECTFGPDEKGYLKMVRAARNRRPVDAELVEKFNMTLPAVMAGKPYLVLPPDWKNPLVDE